jgi:hypothetical protein
MIFHKPYQLQWYDVWDGNATFTSFIFGNQRTNADNSWGPFIYKVSSINYATFFGSDTQQYYSTKSTIKSNTAVYGTTSYPGMQGAVGYTTTGTNNNIYYMRDCCGFAGIWRRMGWNDYLLIVALIFITQALGVVEKQQPEAFIILIHIRQMD